MAKQKKSKLPKKKVQKKSLSDKVKNLDVLDIQLIKFSMIVFTLFIISFLSQNVIDKIIDLRWIWFITLILFAIKPFTKYWIE
jgi:hypothetical protein